MADISQITIPVGSTTETYDIDAKTVNGKTVEANVPSGAVFTDAKVLQEYEDNLGGAIPLLFSGSSSTSNYTGQTYKSGNITGEIVDGTLYLKKGSKELDLAPNDIWISGAGNSWDADENQSLKSALAAKQPYISNTARWVHVSISDAVSVTSGTNTTLKDVTLFDGLWIIRYSVTFPNNSSGYRRIYLSDGSSSANYNSRVTVAAVNGAVTDVLGVALVNITSGSDKLYLRCLQNSGSTLSVSTADIRCIRVS